MTKKYGCHSLPPHIDGYYAKDGFDYYTGKYRIVYVENTFSKNCRNTDWGEDPQCEGCTREKDQQYIDAHFESKAKEVRQVLLHTMRSG